MLLATHKNVLNIIQSKFLAKEVVKTLHLNAGLLQKEWKDENRILAVVQCNLSYAVFVIISEKEEPESFLDLTIEKVVPIDQYFSCDTEPIANNYTNIIFNIIYKSTKLEFNIEIGFESSNFASEVIRCKEISSNNSLNFDWLEKYITEEMDDNCPDIVVARQKIAQGQGISANRESYLRSQLSVREREYTHKQEFSVFVGTWNVNGQPPTVSLKEWLSYDDEPPDVYAIGFQELDLSKEAFLLFDTPREAEWRKAIADAVHPGAKYRSVAFVRLVGMQLEVLVNNAHYKHIKNVAIDTVGTGILGKMGNKGGVAVRLELHNTLLCFVNAHLAAGVEEVERRNQDYNDINQRVNFRRNPYSIRDHEQVYWFGDLNYRITEQTALQVKKFLAANDLKSVLLSDQLNQQKDLSKVLQDYVEGDITFQPTYKYDLNSDVFDTSEKARAPAGTDRILWRGEGINQVSYRSHMSLKISDHKPVSALFKSEISVIDQNKYRKVHEELLKKMDKLENEFLPQVTVDQTELIFDLVKFKEPQYREIIIANTGQVLAEFEFIKKFDDSSYCKEWLNITPFSGCIKPGEKCDIQLKVNLEQPLEEIDDILVLHLIGGKDMFITVTGKCQKSCFTTSIATLCRAPVPLLQLTSEQFKNAENQQSSLLYSVPRELWLIVDYFKLCELVMNQLMDDQTLKNKSLKYRVCLYELLICIFNQNYHHSAMYLQRATYIFRNGIGNSSLELSLVCRNGLNVLEKLSQPICPTMRLCATEIYSGGCSASNIIDNSINGNGAIFYENVNTNELTSSDKKRKQPQSDDDDNIYNIDESFIISKRSKSMPNGNTIDLSNSLKDNLDVDSISVDNSEESLNCLKDDELIVCDESIHSINHEESFITSKELEIDNATDKLEIDDSLTVKINKKEAATSEEFSENIDEDELLNSLNDVVNEF